MIGVFDHSWISGLFGDEEALAIRGEDRQIGQMRAFEAAFSRALGAAGIVEEATAEATARRTITPILARLGPQSRSGWPWPPRGRWRRRSRYSAS